MTTPLNFEIDIILDFTTDICELLAISLYEKMKTLKLNVKPAVIYSFDGDTIHYLIYYKNCYLDVMGFHSTRYLLNYWQNFNPEITIMDKKDTRKWLNEIKKESFKDFYSSKDIKYADKIADRILNTNEFLNF